eukprot:TRINITY_DN16211_c0_g1_i1.p1 TRINITY_DN16211_c0_g1~~TRINITY_DN16211_c0_g1_i1.p1  ORF type:complete len:478 (-),score=75.71 TRINITY_DN16211_c0_g1_i1:438-1871(-)
MASHNQKVIVLDNGGATCKVGIGGTRDPVKVMPNYVARAKGVKKPFVSDQVDACDDIQGINLRRPLDRGYVVNWEAQKEIWDRAFNVHLKVKPPECSLLLTEAPFTLPSIQKATDEVVFEEYGFNAYCTVAPALLSHVYQEASSQQQASKRARKGLLARSSCSLVLDAGFSFTHAVPIFEGCMLTGAVRRLNLGGKALTNHLKELVSYRAWNMMDETFLMEDVKERVCFVSMDVPQDLRLARKQGKVNSVLHCEYILPDGVLHRRGVLKDEKAAMAPIFERRRALDEEKIGSQGRAEGERSSSVGGNGVAVVAAGGADEKGKSESRRAGLSSASAAEKNGKLPDSHQELELGNERFMVPEMLFHPVDLGVNQAGVAECIFQAISACPSRLHPLLYSNILLTGGSTMFPFFRERLEMELRPLVPDEYDLGVHQLDSPHLSVWRGGSIFSQRPAFQSRLVRKRDYEEIGSALCREKFKQ